MNLSFAFLISPTISVSHAPHVWQRVAHYSLSSKHHSKDHKHRQFIIAASLHRGALVTIPRSISTTFPPVFLRRTPVSMAQPRRPRVPPAPPVLLQPPFRSTR